MQFTQDYLHQPPSLHPVFSQYHSSMTTMRLPTLCMRQQHGQVSKVPFHLAALLMLTLSMPANHLTHEASPHLSQIARARMQEIKGQSISFNFHQPLGESLHLAVPWLQPTVILIVPTVQTQEWRQAFLHTDCLFKGEPTSYPTTIKQQAQII